MGVVAARAFDPTLITSLLQKHGGTYPFSDLVDALIRGGLTEAEARDFVWRLLSEGFVQFTSDRKQIRLLPEEPAEKVAG